MLNKRDGRSKARAKLGKSLEKFYSFRLYVTGQTPRSSTSIQNLRDICAEFLPGRFDLEVIDIYQQPERAQEAQILAAPTLVKELPKPLRRFVGDLSDRNVLLVGLDIKKANER